MFQKEKRTLLQFILVTAICAVSGCGKSNTESSLFEALDNTRTGLDFENKLTPTDSFNLFNYMYYYNGSGVGAGDFNNDGNTDLFFAANQGENKIYLNDGDLKFRDITKAAEVPQDGGWSTGVSIVDINNDGWLDIYISRVGNYQSLHSKNQFLVCQGLNNDGIPVYKNMAAEYGLDYSGFSTHAAFADIDMDGDLDMFLLNHSVHESGVYRPRQEFLGKTHPVAGARLFRNDGSRFSDVTASSGINSSVIGYGLGICVADINLDGYPDIYIGNDFHENDYLYINNGKGVFTEEITSRINHTSRFTMGVDIADINNDGHSEIITMDMLSDDPYILKRSLGEDDYDIFNLKISYGYQHQYTRNNLQYNRRNGTFTETGLYAGVAATDWSWSPLWMDFDNDGLKDLFISNGIPKRMNDIDYINFISNEEMQRKLAPGSKGTNSLEMIEKFPKIKIPNKFFHNDGGLKFTDIKTRIGNAPETYSNGAVYADFDNDGDLDVVVNNIDAPATLYRNNTNNVAAPASKKSDNQKELNVGNRSTASKKSGSESASKSGSESDASTPVTENTNQRESSLPDLVPKSFLKFNLKGNSSNLRAIGSKIIIFSNDGIRLYEKFPVHGFQSTIETPMLIGLAGVRVDSMILVWPDNSFQKLPAEQLNKTLDLAYKPGLPAFDYRKVFYSNHSSQETVTDLTNQIGIKYSHHENVFAEFNREPLIPHMISTEGPALAVGDMNGDGLDDIFIGAARSGKPALWIQDKTGKFSKSMQSALDSDSAYEDVSACWSDVNHDGKPDLVVASGGNEFYNESEMLLPRVYLNDGQLLTKKANAIKGITSTVSVVAAADFNGDGYSDLFLGGRAVPMEYGTIPNSYLLMNDGTGQFTDVTNINSPGLKEIGFVTSASWADMDKDGDADLLVSTEWGGLKIFVNNQATLIPLNVTDKIGWWSFMKPVDVDNDGDIDLVAGNLGLNSRLKATDQEPVNMYYYDFDGNGRKEQILTYFLNHKEVPFASIAELSKQMPVIKKKFLYAGDFAKADLAEIFDSDKLKEAISYSANYFSNALFINDGKMKFELKALPWEAQLTSYRDAVVMNANDDALPDLLLVGNFFDSNTDVGRYDGDAGTILINKGHGNFVAETLNSVKIKGQTRHVEKFRSIDKKQYFILARNNDSALVIGMK